MEASEQRQQLYHEAIKAFSAASAAGDKNPIYGLADWYAWQALIAKASKANDAYLKHLKDSKPPQADPTPTAAAKWLRG